MKRKSDRRKAVSLPRPSQTRPNDPPAIAAHSRPSHTDRLPTAILLAAIGHAAVYSILSAIKYEHALYDDFDLAIFSQAVHQLLRGSLFSSIRGMAWLGDHASLNLFLAAPLYAVVRSPVTLLVIQSAALGLGAIPAYRLAARELGDPRAGSVLAAAWLLHPILGYVNLFEFHPEALSATPLLFAFDALRTGRHARLAFWSSLALLGREDVALVVAMMGIHAVIARVPRPGRALGICFGLAAVSLLITFAWLRPALAGPQAEYGLMYRAWGESPVDVVRGIARDPARALAALVGTPGNAADTLLKREYWLHLLGPLAFLSLLSPATMLIPLPILIEHMLSVRGAQHTVLFQYGALVAPFVVAASAVGLRNGVALIARHRREAAGRVLRTGLAAVALCSVAGQILIGPLTGLGVVQSMTRPQPILPSAEQRALEPHWRSMLGRIPEDGGVVASFQFLPRLSARGDLHSVHHLLSGRYTFSRAAYPVPTGVRTAIVNLQPSRLLESVNLGTAGRWRQLLAEANLAPAAAVDDLVLLLRGPPEIELFSRADSLPRNPAFAAFDDSLEYLGYDGVPAPVSTDGIVFIRTYWKRTGIVRDLHVAEIVVLDSRGIPMLRREHFVGYTINPPHEWPEDEGVRETYRLQLPGNLEPGSHRMFMRLLSVARGMRPLTAEPATAPGGFIDIGMFEVVARSPGDRGGSPAVRGPARRPGPAGSSRAGSLR